MTAQSPLAPTATATAQKRWVNQAIQQQAILDGINEEGKHTQEDDGSGDQVKTANGAPNLAAQVAQIKEGKGPAETGATRAVKTAGSPAGHNHAAADDFRRSGRGTAHASLANTDTTTQES